MATARDVRDVGQAARDWPDSMRMYGISEQEIAALATERFAASRVAYQRNGGARSNLAYGYVLAEAG